MWNDKETNTDLLGHEKIAQTVIEIIGDNHLRPLTIGIYGDWGVGKSSILSILQSKVQAENKVKVSNSHCIMFNGWLFQGYEDTKSALMETVVTELAALQPKHKQIQKLAKSLLDRINWLKVAKLTAGAVLTGVTGLPAVGILGEALTRTKKMTEATDDDSVIKEEEETETVTSQIHAFRKEFKKLIETSKADHIIVLVDDLDRCLPKSVIEILEAIRLFLFVEGTTFVISADEKMIEYAVREHFPNLPASYTEYTKNYLEKLIQIPIRIPTLTRLQTGNYIRLLMLQHHLKNDYEQLQTVYEAYNLKKKRPYDPVELSYDLITQAISSTTVELKETLFVAGQLTPTLSAGLKGNPRNIKRFLNTLFLRMRISEIYGLDDIVKLNELAKLMLLERFQTDYFNKLVDEVTSSSDGKSQIIRDEETPVTTDGNQENPTTLPVGEESVKNNEFKNWVKLEPLLGNIDLRPYIFISKEKAIGFDVDGLFPDHLVPFLEQLSSNSDIVLNKVGKDLANLAIKERILLFDRLEAESRSIGDLKSVPPPVNGLLRIIAVEPSLEDRFLALIESYPTNALGPWVVSQLSGLKTSEAKIRFKKLCEQWGNQTENRILAGLAKQNLN
jgi:predicted KAP-like P-loop ATPase